MNAATEINYILGMSKVDGVACSNGHTDLKLQNLPRMYTVYWISYVLTRCNSN